MVDDLTSPAGRLKAARKKLFPSASAAARVLGIPVGTYAGYENGSRDITAKAARRLALRLQVSPEWILYGKGKAATVIASKNVRELSLFLTNEIDYFIQIHGGAYAISEKMTTIDNSELLPKLPFLLPFSAGSRDVTGWLALLYPEGVKVFVDPDTTVYEPEDVVHAVIFPEPEPENKDAKSQQPPPPPISVIREYRRQKRPEGGVRVILHAYNPAYEDILLDEGKGDFIVGAVEGMLFLPRRR